MNWVRPAAVAGRFYPGNEKKLYDLVEGFCPRDSTLVLESPSYILAPHAGLIYSGRIAGEVYRRITAPQRVVILCPNHTGRGSKVSVWAEGEWITPLGNVKVDEALAQSFLSRIKFANPDQGAHLYEHAIEVQLPFLQYLNPQVSILPIVLGPLFLTNCLQLGEALSALIEAGDGTLIVASSDMSHYVSAARALQQDSLALEQWKGLNPSGLYEAVVRENISMCGFVPTTCVLAAAVGLENAQAELLSYGHSGEVTQDDSSVVGYASGWVI